MDLDERARRYRDYMESLEEERRKIMVFQRELPLCLQLVTQAIESCKQQIGGEDASSDGGPVLAEFISLKPSSTGSESEESCRQDDKPVEEKILDKKPDWLRSVQLWKQELEPLPNRDHPRKPVAVNARKLGGAFHPFEKEKHALLVDRLTPATSSTAETTTTGGGGGGGGADTDKEKEGQSLHSNRKARRCWSPELHRRFLHALQQLGGSHAATPKQIRELMKVDDLTNDEVKSHLQKYRLHTRRPTAAVQSSSNSNSNPQAPHFVVVGGIWVPPPEYAAAAAAVAAAAAQPTEATGPPHNGIYAPVASLPSEFRSQHQQNKQSSRSPNGPLPSERRCSQDDSSIAEDGASNSASPASSSSQTITASPPNDA